jgi:N-acetylglutamate synthase-like GNAT family acetyltransferase
MSITIRAATQADQSTIVSMIREAKINPRNLHWEHFRIAEEDGKIIGIRQVKVHKEGTREVASGFDERDSEPGERHFVFDVP